MQNGEFLDVTGFYPHLKGERAILRPSTIEDRVLAQFNNPALAEAFGWQEFHVNDFKIEPKDAS